MAKKTVVEELGRTERLEIRVDYDEKAAFKSAAELAGVPLSSWVRERLRRMARTELEDADLPVPFVKSRI
jgi:uncharacterized protein (DUF1778 family)